MNIEEVRDLAIGMGPLVSFCTVSADGTPHVVPVVAVWDGPALMFASRVSSLKVRHLRARPRAAVQIVTLGSPFPDALLIKGTSEVVDDDARKQAFWESGMFPFLPQMYRDFDDPQLCFVRFAPAAAFLTPEGGRGEVRSWRSADLGTPRVHPRG